MRLMIFLKLMLACICVSLLWFGLSPDSTIMGLLKALAIGAAGSIAVAAVYPEVRGVRKGDTVSIITDGGIPGIIGRVGRAGMGGRRNDQIKILLQNGNEALGIIESYTGIISPPRIRIVYEERLVD